MPHAKYLYARNGYWMISLQCEALPQTQTLPMQVASYGVLSGPDWENGFSDSLRNFEDGKGFGFPTRLLRRMQDDFSGHVSARVLGRTTLSYFLLQNASRPLKFKDFMRFLNPFARKLSHYGDGERRQLIEVSLPAYLYSYLFWTCWTYLKMALIFLQGFAISGDGQRISFPSDSLGKPAVFALFVSFGTVEVAIGSLCMYSTVIDCHWWFLIFW